MKKFVIYLLMIGFLFLGINIVFPDSISFISTKDIVFNNTHNTIYYIDFWSYINNIKTTLNVDQLQLSMPTRTWRMNSSLWDIFDMLANNLALMLDYILLAFNILLYPIRIAGYGLRVGLGIVGINIENPSNSMIWLKNVIDFLAGLQLRYV